MKNSWMPRHFFSRLHAASSSSVGVNAAFNSSSCSPCTCVTERNNQPWPKRSAPAWYRRSETTPRSIGIMSNREFSPSEAISKLKECQGKRGFHSGKRAVADEIHGALRWRICHANHITPMWPMRNGPISNAAYRALHGPVVRVRMTGRYWMAFGMSCTLDVAGRICRTIFGPPPRRVTGGCWSTNGVGSGNVWSLSWWKKPTAVAYSISRIVLMTPVSWSREKGKKRSRLLGKTPN